MDSQVAQTCPRCSRTGLQLGFPAFLEKKHPKILGQKLWQQVLCLKFLFRVPFERMIYLK